MFGARQQMSHSKWKSPPGKIYRQDQLKQKIDFNFPSIDIKQLNACFENAGGGLWHKHAQKISCYGFTQVCPHKISYCPLVSSKKWLKIKIVPHFIAISSTTALCTNADAIRTVWPYKLNMAVVPACLKALNYAINAQKAIFCHKAKIFFSFQTSHVKEPSAA